MRRFLYNDSVEVFDLTVRPADIPDWLSNEKERKKLLKKKSKGLPASPANTIQLLENFNAPDLSTCLQVTPDGRYLLLCGAYKPVMKCFDLDTLALKWHRGLDENSFQVLCLSDDYSKLVLRQDNRTIEFHDRCGMYHRLRVPQSCTYMTYSRRYHDLYMTGISNEVWRFNLGQAGAFQQPILKSKLSKAFTTCAVEDEACILLVGSSEGVLEMYDTRQPKSAIAHLNTVEGNTPRSCVRGLSSDNRKPYISKITFRNHLQFGVGYSDGLTYIYDIRQRQPLMWRDQGLGQPIVNLSFQDDKVISVDSHSLAIWDIDQTSSSTESALWCAFNLEEKTNDMVHIPESGLLFFANDEGSHIQTYFIPALGRAPSWCPNLLHYLREKSRGGEEFLSMNTDSATASKYKLLTRSEISQYGLDYLIGTEHMMARNHCFAINKAKFDAIMKEKNITVVDETNDEQKSIHPEPRLKVRLNNPENNGDNKAGDAKSSQDRDLDIMATLTKYSKDRDYITRVLADPAFHIEKTHVEFQLLETHLSFKSKKAKAKERRRRKAALADAMAVDEEIN